MFADGKDKDINKILRHVSDLEEKGDVSEAIKELNKAIDLDPQDGNLFNRLGDLCVKNKDTKEATEAYKKGILAYKKDDYFRNAITLCKKIMRHDPDNLEVNLIIA